MAKLIDKTPRDLFSIGYQRIEPISLALIEGGYKIMGVNLSEERPCLYNHAAVNQSPEVFFAHNEGSYFVGDCSIGNFYSPEDMRNFILAKQKRLPIPLTKRGRTLPTARVHKRSGFLKREVSILPNVLRTRPFNIQFKVEHGDLSFEQAVYAASKKIIVEGREVDIGFEEWEMRVDYFCNRFTREEGKENLLALINENAVIALDRGDILEFHPGFRLQFYH